VKPEIIVPEIGVIVKAICDLERPFGPALGLAEHWNITWFAAAEHGENPGQL